ncbi:MAG: Peptidoglycan glycosyltransferase [Candidatus Daviesbacteria bacterium GW2011_GWF2_38_6]|uniref:beta-lactamase n=1 Tax=Candidatus Daviesbacteria bacterium GW2011_GWF2_38_6 TaxID=1618432 RepID=A0A0G0KSG0_9BACT|nr:MAG: Peptidoglycan glycosyltransferase [Candidatus Daviesbacteria bacterium GW2011_GWF2_38_6]
MRIYLIKIFFLIFFFSILARLFYWQVVKADFLQAKGENQHFKDTAVEAERGKIFFSDKAILATSNPSFSLYGLPKVITQEEKLKMSYLLAKIFVDDSSQIDAEAKNILNSLQQDLYWVPIKKGLDQKTKKKIEDLNLIGIGFNTASGRFYPEGSSSAHLLGFVGSDAKGGQKGYFGLEGFYEGELKGMPGFLRHEKDALGLPILIGKFLTNKANNGKDLVLNIDRSIQFTVEEVLKQGLEKYGAWIQKPGQFWRWHLSRVMIR